MMLDDTVRVPVDHFGDELQREWTLELSDLIFGKFNGFTEVFTVYSMCLMVKFFT